MTQRLNYPITTGIRFLREHGVSFTPHLYTYEEHGGTRVSAISLGVEEHTVIKTLVMHAEGGGVALVLMHGDREVSTKRLARAINVKRIDACDAVTAERNTGYQFGGTSPFGTRRPLPIYAERTIFDLPHIYINAGKRGFLVKIDPRELLRVLPVTQVDVATPL